MAANRCEVAQTVEQVAVNHPVTGSIPVLAANRIITAQSS